MTHLDLCSGIGGCAMAAGWAGFETIGFAEIDPYCCKILKRHWPGIKNYGDIRRADFSSLRGTVTVLSAGVPCQPASLAGKRRGAADERWLWEAVLDVVGSVQATWCLLENPDGILTLGEFGGILLRLESLGYAVRAFRVPANAVGAKHRRYRVFIVAHADNSQWRQSQSAGNEFNGSASGRQEAADRLARSGEEALRHAAGTRLPSRGCSQSGTFWDQAWREKSSGRGNGTETVADADRAGLEEHFSRQSGQCATIERGGRINGFRLTEPPLCGRADGIPNRLQRLKALGNSIVPQQVYPFFVTIAQLYPHLEDQELRKGW